MPISHYTLQTYINLYLSLIYLISKKVVSNHFQYLSFCFLNLRVILLESHSDFFIVFPTVGKNHRSQAVLGKTGATQRADQLVK